MSGWEHLDRWFAPHKRRIQGMVARAVIGLVDDTLKAQGLQLSVLAGEVQDGVERFQDYGYTSVPHPGAEAVVVYVGGLRSHGIVVACEDRRYRLKGLEVGEVALYDDLGQAVILKRDGIRVVSPTKVVVEAPIVALGDEGGPAVARVGDPVVNNKIAAGSTKVTSA